MTHTAIVFGEKGNCAESSAVKAWFYLVAKHMGGIGR